MKISWMPLDRFYNLYRIKIKVAIKDQPPGWVCQASPFSWQSPGLSPSLPVIQETCTHLFVIKKIIDIACIAIELHLFWSYCKCPGALPRQEGYLCLMEASKSITSKATGGCVTSMELIPRLSSPPSSPWKVRWSILKKRIFNVSPDISGLQVWIVTGLSHLTWIGWVLSETPSWKFGYKTVLQKRKYLGIVNSLFSLSNDDSSLVLWEF